MSKKKLLITMLICSVCISLFACSAQIERNETKSNEFNGDLESVPLQTVENLFESTEETKFEVKASYGIDNQIYDENDDIWYLGYEGGELQIDVGVQTSQDWLKHDNSKAELGIQIWIDGVPQAFRIDDENEYAYMQTYILPVDEYKTISCYFVPTVGEKGDLLSVEVSQFWYPSYQPDMVEYKVYEDYRWWPCMIVKSKVKYYETPEQVEDKTKMENCVLHSSLKQRQLSLEERDIYEDDINYSSEGYIQYRMWINGEDNAVNAIDGMDTVKVQLWIFGPVGLNVDCNLYLNHIPLESDWEEIRQIQMADGEIIVLEIEMDVTQLEGINEFYAVIVPLNGTDNGYNINAVKTGSACFYREADLDFAE